MLSYGEVHTAVETGDRSLNQVFASAQLEGLALCMCKGVGVSCCGVGWCFALSQLQRPELSASVVPVFLHGLGTGKQEETQVSGISECEYLWGESLMNSAGSQSTVAVLFIGFINRKISWVCPQEESV